jgi:hypothetical protein
MVALILSEIGNQESGIKNRESHRNYLNAWRRKNNLIGDKHEHYVGQQFFGAYERLSRGLGVAYSGTKTKMEIGKLSQSLTMVVMPPTRIFVSAGGNLFRYEADALSGSFITRFQGLLRIRHHRKTCVAPGVQRGQRERPLGPAPGTIRNPEASTMHDDLLQHRSRCLVRDRM